MSTTFKPEVYAIGVPFNKITFKPEFYVLFIPAEKCIYLNVLKQEQTLSLPFYLTQKGFSVAIRWDDKDWFNKLVLPNDPNASDVCVLYNDVTYRLSLI